MKTCDDNALLKYLLLLLPEQNRRGLRRDQASRRMVALYDYDPRESSPNVDVEVSLIDKELGLKKHLVTESMKHCITRLLYHRKGTNW